MTYNRDNKEETIGYFTRLTRLGHESCERFEAGLRNIARHKLSLCELIGVIKNIRCYIEQESEDNPRLTGNLVKILRDNLAPWKNQMLQALHPCKEEQIQSSGLAKIACSLAWLGIHPGHALVVAMCKRLHHKNVKDNIAPIDAMQISRAFAVFETIMPNDMARATACDLIGRLPHEYCPQEIENAAVLLSQFFGLSCNGWRILRDTPDTVSLKEERASQLFNSATKSAIVVRRDYRVPGIDHRPDFVLESDAGNALVEFDGPSHFVGEDLLTGPTIFMGALLAQLHPDRPVVRLSHQAVADWSQQPGGACSAAARFLTQTVDMPAGAHLYSRAQRFEPLAPSALRH